MVYFFGGIAKIYPDWIAAKPIGIWFRSKSNYFIVESLLAKEWFQFFIAYGGVVFDTLIAPALIWKHTRKMAFIATILFHLFNSAVFQVGIFPYMGIAFGLFFFAPEVISKIFFKNKTIEKTASAYPQNRWLVAALIGREIAFKDNSSIEFTNKQKLRIKTKGFFMNRVVPPLCLHKVG